MEEADIEQSDQSRSPSPPALSLAVRDKGKERARFLAEEFEEDVELPWMLKYPGNTVMDLALEDIPVGKSFTAFHSGERRGR